MTFTGAKYLQKATNDQKPFTARGFCGYAAFAQGLTAIPLITLLHKEKEYS